MSKPHRKVPPIVISLCFNCEGWIVGSMADVLAGKVEKTTENDYDIVIPAKYWNDASHICVAGEHVSVNSFGGLKITTNGVNIDVWMDDVADLMANFLNKSAYHLKTKTYITREKL